MTAVSRRLLLATVVLTTLAPGLWAGLGRLGLALPLALPSLQAAHGPLMGACFLGGLVAAERAVALGRLWAFAGPVLAVLAAVTLIAGVPAPVPAVLATGNAVVLLLGCGVAFRLQRSLHVGVMAAGAVAFVVGAALWARGEPSHVLAPWWATGIVVTIVGERLERSRLLALPPSRVALLLVALGVLATGLVQLTLQGPWGAGARVFGAGLAGTAAWLLRFELAWKTRRMPGLPGFMAVSVLGGHVWLAFAGTVLLLGGATVAGPRHDAVMHGLFFGFVMSMVIGHAPAVVPAMTGFRLAFVRALWLPFVALHVSLLVRVAADFAGSLVGRQVGGLAGAVTIVLIPASLLLARRAASRQAAPTTKTS